MSQNYKCEPGDTIDIVNALYDGATDQYPQSKIYSVAGALVATVNLTHTAAGLYQGTYAPDGTYKHLTVHTIVYSNAGHTVENTLYGRFSDKIYVGYDYKSPGFGSASSVATLSGKDKTEIIDSIVKKLDLSELLSEIQKKSEFDPKKDTVKTDIKIPTVNLRDIKDDLIEIKKLSSIKTKEKDYSLVFSKFEKSISLINDTLSSELSSLKIGLGSLTKTINSIEIPKPDMTPIMNKFADVVDSLDVNKKEKKEIMSAIGTMIDGQLSGVMAEHKKAQALLNKQLLEFNKRADVLESMLEKFNVEDFNRINLILEELKKINQFQRILSSTLINQKLNKDDELSGVLDLLKSK